MYPTLTPSRPLPGTYFQTPASTSVNHGSLFQRTPTAAARSSPATALQKRSPAAASKTKTETLSTRERAARTINDTLAMEARYPDLDSYLARELLLGARVTLECVR